MLDRALRKANSSMCRIKIAAISVWKGRIVYASNRPRYMRKGGGVHAEMALMRRYGKAISEILILRTNKSGHLLPIEPCEVCARKARELGIKIKTIL